MEENGTENFNMNIIFLKKKFDALKYLSTTKLTEIIMKYRFIARTWGKSHEVNLYWEVIQKILWILETIACVRLKNNCRKWYKKILHEHNCTR